jgi:ankyrin repeat protein
MNDEYEDSPPLRVPLQREVDAFANAASNNDLAGAALFLSQYAAFIDSKNSNGDTAMTKAAAAGFRPMVEMLLANGARIDAPDKNSWTPLIAAAQKGHTDLTLFLIEQGARINAKAQEGWTALMWAARMEHPDTVTLLLEKGADIEEKNAHSKTALMICNTYACRSTAKILEQWPELLRQREELKRKENERIAAENAAKEKASAHLEQLKKQRPPKPPFKKGGP